jgi:hypothetical protein
MLRKGYPFSDILKSFLLSHVIAHDTLICVANYSLIISLDISSFLVISGQLVCAAVDLKIFEDK